MRRRVGGRGRALGGGGGGRPDGEPSPQASSPRTASPLTPVLTDIVGGNYAPDLSKPRMASPLRMVGRRGGLHSELACNSGGSGGESA